MDNINFFVFSSFLINLALSLFLLRNSLKTKSSSTRYFSYFGLTITFWCITMFLFRQVGTESESLLLSRILYFAASFTPSTYVIFCLSFLDQPVKRKSVFIIMFLNLVVAISTFHPQFINSVVIPASGEKIINFGIVYTILYTAYIPTLFMTGFSILIFKYFKYSTPLTKAQLSLIIIGSISTSSLAMVSNLLMPTFGDFRLNWFGQISTIIWISTVFYAIIRYQLFDIRVILGRVTYFSLTTVIVLIGYYFALNLTTVLFEDPRKIATLITGIPIALTFVLFYDGYRHYIQKNISSKLINPGFDIPEETIKYNSRMGSLVKYDTVTEELIKTIEQTTRPQYVGIISIVKGIYYLNEGTQKKNLNISVQRLVEIWEKVDFTILYTDLLEYDLPRKFLLYRDEILNIQAQMNKFGIKILAPIHKENKIYGVMALGPKEGDDLYNSVQIEYLRNLCEITALGMVRAYLYKDIDDFNKNLQNRIEAATHQIAEKNKRLEETLKFERDMLDILGHELRTPLGTVRNAIGVFGIKYQSGKISNEEVSKFVDMSTENIKREIQLLEALLASAKIDNQKLSLDFSQVDANDVVMDSFESYRYDSKTKGLDLRIELPETKLVGYADRLRIQQVMDNLTSNAVKYTATGTVTLKLEDIGDRLKFSVQDTGEGIAAEDIPKLGQKFFRINPYLNSDGKLGNRKIVRPGGTGIGLYVVFQLIKYMYGEISVTSKLGEGSVFSFTVKKYFDGIENTLKVNT